MDRNLGSEIAEARGAIRRKLSTKWKSHFAERPMESEVI